ncbi:PREDICTED: sorting nexin-6 [Calidris pugnax]|uniref:sorting nexin-6 n=1 Tax=Calidris pugnax TaxID=198806 RepID=UPI00071DDCDA|nr:PREDICTED: sorting nexin-6 [Calidris pugnax]
MAFDGFNPYCALWVFHVQHLHIQRDISMSRVKNQTELACLEARAAAQVLVITLWESVGQRSHYGHPAHPGCFAANDGKKRRTAPRWLVVNKGRGWRQLPHQARFQRFCRLALSRPCAPSFVRRAQSRSRFCKPRTANDHRTLNAGVPLLAGPATRPSPRPGSKGENRGGCDGPQAPQPAGSLISPPLPARRRAPSRTHRAPSRTRGRGPAPFPSAAAQRALAGVYGWEGGEVPPVTPQAPQICCGPDQVDQPCGEDQVPSLFLRAINVDLQTDAALQVDISDALSERDKVKFTVHTKSSLPNFKQNEFSVVRQHEEFIWLHDSFVENEDYAGYIIPPAPPRPDFDASREKLQKLGEGEGSMTKEEFTKMKQELEAEYLAIFKKTVAMHEVFLCRVAAHPILRKDLNFHVFLEYNQDLSVRGKNKKEKLEDFFKNMVKSADGVIVSGVKDVDDFFEHERTFLVEYHNRVKDASAKSDKMTRSHKNVADDYNRIGSSLYALGTQDSTDICKFFLKVSELFDKTRKIEARVSADEDLKLSDLLKYYLRESQAAKDLLYRRSRSLVDYENANKALDKARAKNKDVLQAENTQQICCQKFEKISESAKQELIDFKTRRVAAFRKNLVELAELELKHAKGNLQLLQSCLAVLNGDT